MVSWKILVNSSFNCLLSWFSVLEPGVVPATAVSVLLGRACGSERPVDLLHFTSLRILHQVGLSRRRNFQSAHRFDVLLELVRVLEVGVACNLRLLNCQVVLGGKVFGHDRLSSLLLVKLFTRQGVLQLGVAGRLGVPGEGVFWLSFRSFDLLGGDTFCRVNLVASILKSIEIPRLHILQLGSHCASSTLWAPSHHLPSKHCSVIDLDTLWLVVARMRVHIVRLHELAVEDAAVRRLSVAVTICMESRLAEVGGHGGIGQVTTLEFQICHLLLHVTSSYFTQHFLAFSFFR